MHLKFICYSHTHSMLSFIVYGHYISNKSCQLFNQFLDGPLLYFSWRVGQLPPSFSNTTWEGIEGLHLWSMGSCQRKVTSIGALTPNWRGHPSVHSIDEEFFISGVWEAASARLLHGITQLEGTSICPFHRFGLPCYLVHVVIYCNFYMTSSEGEVAFLSGHGHIFAS